MHTKALERLRSNTPLSWLTPRERQMLSMIMRSGCADKQIAADLEIHVGTVRNTLSALYRKLGVSSRNEAQTWVWQNFEEAERGYVARRGLHPLDCCCERCLRFGRWAA